MKSIILCAPADFELFYAIKDSLEDLGFKVYGFPIEDGNYKYKNIFTRINNLLRKIFLGDTQYKNRLKLKERRTKLEKQLLSVPFSDFALFIRPDMYPVEFIQKVQHISLKTAAYHWDSLERFPNAINYIKLFDSFYVFDERDLITHPTTKLLTNFYFPDDSTIEVKDTKQAFLIGSDYTNRINESIQLKTILTQLGYSCNFILKTNKAKNTIKLNKNGIKTISKAIPYNLSLENVKRADIVIDLHNNQQTGLSFRIFEALNYSKKLITTNPHIIKYDFYHPNNIFIWNGNNNEELEKFLEKEYIEIDTNIKSKYGLGNWINYIFKEKPYLEIF